MHGKGNPESVRKAFQGYVKNGLPVILSEESFLLGGGFQCSEQDSWESKIKRLAWALEGLDSEYWIASRAYRSLAFSFFMELGKSTLRKGAPLPSWWLRESNAFGILRPTELLSGLAPIHPNVFWMDFEEVTSGRLNQQMLGLHRPLPHRHATKSTDFHSTWRGQRGVLDELAAVMRPSIIRTLIQGFIHYGMDITRLEEIEVRHWTEGFWVEHVDLEASWESFRRERLANAGVMECSRLRLG